MKTARNLTGLRPQAYEHPSDTSALNILTHTAGLDTVVRKLNAWGFERILRVQLTGSYLRTTRDSFPDLHELLDTACARLDLPLRPDLYIAAGAELNALTAGVEHPLLLLYSGLIEALTTEELLYVIGHEVGHIKSCHVLYYQIAEFLPVIAEVVGSATMGIGELLGAGMQLTLLRWKRMSEFTADRAGLLACQDADVALRTLMKLAGLPKKYYGNINTEDFLAQARAFEAMDSEKLNMLAKWLSVSGASHPWTVLRAQQLLAWIDDGGYERVLSMPEPVPVAADAAPKFCMQCGWRLRGVEPFCPGCGRPQQVQA